MNWTCPKQLIFDQNYLGGPKLFWTHRRTRHNVLGGALQNNLLKLVSHIECRTCNCKASFIFMYFQNSPAAEVRDAYKQRRRAVAKIKVFMFSFKWILTKQNKNCYFEFPIWCQSRQ